MDLQFQKFIQFCEGHLGGSSMKLLDLVKKRYNECDKEYIESHEFSEYILCTEAKINSDGSRFFVHLRDFLSILKENKADVGQYINSHVVNGTKRLLGSSESESDITDSSKRRKVYKSESDNESEQSLGDSSSDQEIERKPDVTEQMVEDDKQFAYESDKQSSESGSLTVEDDSIECQEEESEVEKTKTVEKFQAPLNSPGCTENQALEPVVSIGTETIDFGDSESEKSEILISSLRPDTKEKKNMFSSSEDEEEDAKTSVDIENIINRYEDKNVGNDVNRKEKIETDSKPKCFQCPEATDTTQSPEIVTNTHDEVKSDERESILNTSSESVVILEESGDDIQLDQREMGDNICSEKLEDKNHIYHTESSDLINLKTLPRHEKTKYKSADLNISEEVTIIDHDSTDEDRPDEAVMLEDTYAVGENQDTENESEHGGDAENKIMQKDDKESKIRNENDSSDMEDPFYAANAKKFREKRKKKYVVSVGKKKKDGFSSHSKDHLKPLSDIKSQKDKSPMKKRTPNNSPKCKKKSSPKKSSPSKSPIIIMTDSDSGSDIEDIERFKKKFNEKVNSKFRKQFHIDDDLAIVVDKIPVKFEPMAVDDTAGVNDETSANDELSSDSSKPVVEFKDHKMDNLVSTNMTNKENVLNDQDSCRSYDSDHKKPERTMESKEKTRVSFITEELYNGKPDRKLEDLRKPSKGKVSSEFETASFKDKHKHRNEESCHDKKSNIKQDHEEPGPSSAANGENVKIKGSSKQIRRLEALLENIRNQIEKVRTRELDLDDMESEISDYILEDKLQRKFMKVWDKLCDLHKAIKSTGRPTEKYFRYQGTRYPEINRKIEKFINKRKIFPDYNDIRSIIIKVNKDKRLHLRSREIDDLSREAFTDVGNQLQRRRQKDFVAAFHTPGAEVNPFSLYDDPALYDPVLKKKLDANKKSAKNNMDKVVEKYAALQYQVGDKTDDEDDDDDEEEEEEKDTNTGIDDLDQLSGVDNSDSDNNTAKDDEHVFSAGHGKYGSCKMSETGPCLEIENVENGKKSTFSNDNPDDVGKLTPMKSRVDQRRRDWSPKHAHFSDQLGLCPTPSKKGGNKVSMTVTILSDNEDDNEVKWCSDREKDDLSDTGEKQSTSASDNDTKESADVADSNSTQNSNTESNSAVEGCSDVKTEHTISNQISVTVITDDEDEEGNFSDQSLGLKIVSARHVSFEEISKLHAEGDFDVDEETKQSIHTTADISGNLNNLCNAVQSTVKLDLELAEEIESKTVVLEGSEKLQSVKTLPCQNKGKAAATVVPSEPEVMIIEDIETEQVPVFEKSAKVSSEKIEKFAWKTEVLPKCAVRQGSGLGHAKNTVDGNSAVKVPLKKLSFKHSDVVIIDSEDTKESKKKSVLKSFHSESSSHTTSNGACDVICIDAAPEIEIIREVTKTKTKPKCETQSNNSFSRHTDGSSVTTKGVCLTSKKIENGNDAVKNIPKKHNNVSKPAEVGDSVVILEDDEIKENVEIAGTAEIKKRSGKGRISPENIFADSYGSVEKVESSSIELCEEKEVFEIPEKSDQKQYQQDEIHAEQIADTANSDENRIEDPISSEESFDDDTGSTSLTEKKDITLTEHDEPDENEQVSNSEPEPESLESVNFELELKRGESFGIDVEPEMSMEGSVASSDESEVFTAVKVGTVFMNDKHNSNNEESMEQEEDEMGIDTESETNGTLVEGEEEMLGHGLELDNEDPPSIMRNSNSEVSVEPNMDHTVNAAEMVSASDDEHEVSGGFEDEDKISSTSCETGITTDAKVKLKTPEIRNKFLQLKKAIVNSKPHLKLKSQVRTQEGTSKVTGSSQNAQWIVEDENASLIETYQEPDSTPYNLEENMISSSSSENVIVLSDSE